MAFLKLIGFRRGERGETLDAMCLKCYKTFSGVGDASDIDEMGAVHQCEDFDLSPLMQPDNRNPDPKQRT
jgi:hypothetical protein